MDANDSRHLSAILQGASQAPTLEFSLVSCRAFPREYRCELVHRSGAKSQVGWVSAAYTFDYLRFYGAKEKAEGQGRTISARNVICRKIDQCSID